MCPRLFILFIIALFLLPLPSCKREGAEKEEGKLLLSADDFSTTVGMEIIDDAGGAPADWKIESPGALVQTVDLGSGDETGLYAGSELILDEGPFSDIRIDFRLTLPKDSAGGVVFRRQGDGSRYRLILVERENFSFARLELIEEGKHYVLDSGRVEMEADEEVEITVTAVGDELRVWIEGKERLGARNGELSSGGLGLFAYGAGGVRFKGLLVFEATIKGDKRT